MSREIEVDQVCEFYREFHPRSRPDKKTRGKILDRLRDGYTVQDLKDAIAGCHESDFHNGKNDRNTKYQSLGLIMRDSDHVDKFIQIFEEAAEEKARQFEEWKAKQGGDRESVRAMRALRQKQRGAASE